MTDPVDHLGNRHAIEILRFIDSEGTTQAREIRIFTQGGNFVASTCSELGALGLIEVSRCEDDLRLVFYSLTDKGRQVVSMLNQINDLLEAVQ